MTKEIHGEVIRACQRGEREAFARIVDRYGPALHGLLCRMTRDASLAEDLSQESFLRAFQYIRRYDPRRGPFSTWLFTIVRNLCRTHLTREVVRNRAFRVLEGQAEHRHEPTQRRRLLDEEAEEMLRRSLESLPVDYRFAFLLRVYERLPYGEIAKTLGVRTGTAKSRVHRARRMLREALGPYLESGEEEGRDTGPDEVAS